MAPSPEEGLRSAGLFFMVAADGGRAVSLPELCMCVCVVVVGWQHRGQGGQGTGELGTVTHHRAPACSRGSHSLLAAL